MALDKCRHPFYVKDYAIYVGCGQCLYCKIKKRNEWTGRLIMEKAVSLKCCFVTLTYADEFLPSPPSLDKSALQKFLKRLRKYSCVKIRYYACGEYGDKQGRPHYHLIIFGMDKSEQTIKWVQEAWKFGRISVDPADNDCIRYVAGYVTKKFSKERNLLIKEGILEKEFSLMSRKPALGSAFVDKLVDFAFLQNPYDVLQVFSLGGRSFPLGRVIRNKLRDRVMTDEEKEHIKSLNIALMQEEVLELVKEMDLLNYFDFKKRSKSDNNYDLTWSREVVGNAYLKKNYENVMSWERIFQRRNERKDC